MNRLSYIIRRLIQMIPVFFIVTVLVFVLIRCIPGDPALTMLGDRATHEMIEAYRQKMGYYDPLWLQYFIFLKDLLHFDLGTSLRYSEPVINLILERLPVTIGLTISVVFFTVVIGFPLGFMAGKKRNKLPDYIIRIYSLFGLSAPQFWVGLMLLLMFGVKIKLFPVSNWGDSLSDHIMALILPGITQALGIMAVIIRNLRNNVVDISGTSYVTFARSKGLSEGRIDLRYIFRNALLPTTTILSLWIASLLGGCIIIETVFNLPGLGALMINSVLSRDYSVIQGGVLIFVITVLIINLITDIIYSMLDPRVTLN
ncbi:MAG: ABC transporter permease [Clostridia bacterium]|nr:ABC transporter permease [Clostridia bacterium]